MQERRPEALGTGALVERGQQQQQQQQQTTRKQQQPQEYVDRHRHDAESILKTALAFVVLRRRVKEYPNHSYRPPQDQERQQSTTTSTTAAGEEGGGEKGLVQGPIMRDDVVLMTQNKELMQSSKKQHSNAIRQVYRMALSTAWPLYHSYISNTFLSTSHAVSSHGDHDDCNGNYDDVRTKKYTAKPTKKHGRDEDPRSLIHDDDVYANTPPSSTKMQSCPIYDCHTASLSLSQMKDKIMSQSTSCISKPMPTSTPHKDPVRPHSSSSSSIHTYAVLDGIVSHLATTMVGNMVSSNSTGCPFGMFYHEILLPTMMDVSECCNSSLFLPDNATTAAAAAAADKRALIARPLQTVLCMCTVLHRLVFQKGRNHHSFLVDDLIRGLCRVIRCLYLGNGWFVRGPGQGQNHGRDDLDTMVGEGGGSRRGGCFLRGTNRFDAQKMADIVAVNMLVLLEEMISFKISAAAAREKVVETRHGNGNGVVGGGCVNGGGRSCEEDQHMMILSNKRTSQEAEEILRDLHSILGGGEEMDAFGGGLFLPVPIQEMAGFYLRQKQSNEQQQQQEQEIRSRIRSRVSFSGPEDCCSDEVISKEDDNAGQILLRLSSGAKLMIRIYLFDLMQKLNSYHLDS